MLEEFKGKKSLKEKCLILDLFNITDLIILERCTKRYSQPSEENLFLKIQALSQTSKYTENSFIFVCKVVLKSNAVAAIHSHLCGKDQKIVQSSQCGQGGLANGLGVGGASL